MILASMAQFQCPRPNFASAAGEAGPVKDGGEIATPLHPSSARVTMSMLQPQTDSVMVASA